MTTPLKLVFLGSDPIALPLLDWLAAGGAGLARVAAVYTQPDRAAGRGQQIAPGPIKAWALARGLPVRQPAGITPDETAWLATQRADVALVVAFGHLLPDPFVAAPRLGTLNLHGSLLPKYRGASPVQTAVAMGERETGLTLMRIVRRLDAGPTADEERVPIGPLDTSLEVRARLAAAALPLLARALPRLARGELVFGEQDHAAATYCRRLEKEDGTLDFAAPAPTLAARINGLFPWPSCTVEFNAVPVKLGRAEALPETPGGRPAAATGSIAPGTVMGSDSAGLLVATGGGVLRVRRLQRPGGKLLAAPEFLRGFPLAPGTLLPSRPMSRLSDSRPFR